MSAQSEPDPEYRLARLQELCRERQRLLDRLHELDQEIEKLGSVQEQREAMVQQLRDSVQWIGDVESPIDVEWNAERGRW